MLMTNDKFVLTYSGQICHYLNPLCPLLGIRKVSCGVTWQAGEHQVILNVTCSFCIALTGT